MVALNLELTRKLQCEDIEPEIDEMLRLLPEEQQDAIILHYLVGQSLSEAAKNMGCSDMDVFEWSEEGIENLRGLLSRFGSIYRSELIYVLQGQNLPEVPDCLIERLVAKCRMMRELMAAEGSL